MVESNNELLIRKQTMIVKNPAKIDDVYDRESKVSLSRQTNFLLQEVFAIDTVFNRLCRLLARAPTAKFVRQFIAQQDKREQSKESLAPRLRTGRDSRLKLRFFRHL